MVKSRGGVKNKRNPVSEVSEEVTNATEATDAMDVSGTGSDLTGGDFNSTVSSGRKFYNLYDFISWNPMDLSLTSSCF